MDAKHSLNYKVILVRKLNKLMKTVGVQLTKV